jgi:hypothetical protein
MNNNILTKIIETDTLNFTEENNNNDNKCCKVIFYSVFGLTAMVSISFIINYIKYNYENDNSNSI